MVDFRAELAALVAAYDEHGCQWSESDVDELWHAAERARAVLAQPEPAPAADGEVAELVAWLTKEMPPGTYIGDPAWWASRIAGRAHILMKRQAAAAPVARLPEDAQVIEPASHTILVPVPTPIPVSERLPGSEDCDAEGRCWFYTPASSVLYAYWVLREPDSLRKWETHWLPAHALPLPEFD